MRGRLLRVPHPVHDCVAIAEEPLVLGGGEVLQRRTLVIRISVHWNLHLDADRAPADAFVPLPAFAVKIMQPAVAVQEARLCIPCMQVVPLVPAVVGAHAHYVVVLDVLVSFVRIHERERAQNSVELRDVSVRLPLRVGDISICITALESRTLYADGEACI